MRRFFAACIALALVGVGVALAFWQGSKQEVANVSDTSLATHSTSSSPRETPASASHAAPEEGARVVIGGTSVRVELADTLDERVRGLSGRESLSEGEGMLFVFPEDGRYGFWMKDMNFSIDIIWLSSAGKVVHIAENVPPDSYPASFQPAEPARYVLEVPAGFAKAHNIALGSTASLPR
jgi:uncharacterized protein